MSHVVFTGCREIVHLGWNVDHSNIVAENTNEDTKAIS